MNRVSPQNKPIGVFDSGIGGLTVVRALKAIMPDEHIVYFGDTARVPYGTKSEETIIRFAHQDAQFLIARDVKLIIVACHSASSVALSHLQESFALPIVGVIEPGARRAVATTKNSRIGVIGTPATIGAGAYERAIKQYRRGVEIVAKATPLFVPLVEEGWLDNEVALLVAQTYLLPLKNEGIDTLLLGCTHYPLLKPVINQVLGDGVLLVDSGEETALEAKQILGEQALLKKEKGWSCRYYLSDLTPNFSKVGERFLGEPIPELIRVTIKE